MASANTRPVVFGRRVRRNVINLGEAIGIGIAIGIEIELQSIVFDTDSDPDSDTDLEEKVKLMTLGCAVRTGNMEQLTFTKDSR